MTRFSRKIKNAYIEVARAEYGTDDVEIDDNARFSIVPGEGSWVSGWLWVRNTEAGICGECGRLKPDQVSQTQDICDACHKKQVAA